MSTEDKAQILFYCIATINLLFIVTALSVAVASIRWLWLSV